MTRKKYTKKELTRFCIYEDEICIDLKNKLCGRGYYINLAKCTDILKIINKLQSIFNKKVPVHTSEKIEMIIKSQIRENGYEQKKKKWNT